MRGRCRDRLWVADITYVPTASGFLYLAVVIDAWSRRVVGWCMVSHLKTKLVLDALNMAVRQRQLSRVIHHSDSEFTDAGRWTLLHLLGAGYARAF